MTLIDQIAENLDERVNVPTQIARQSEYRSAVEFLFDAVVPCLLRVCQRILYGLFRNRLCLLTIESKQQPIKNKSAGERITNLTPDKERTHTTRKLKSKTNKKITNYSTNWPQLEIDASHDESIERARRRRGNLRARVHRVEAAPSCVEPTPIVRKARNKVVQTGAEAHQCAAGRWAVPMTTRSFGGWNFFFEFGRFLFVFARDKQLLPTARIERHNEP